MTTLTPTAARANLSNLLRRALKGDDIGIVFDGRIVALRPVAVESVDYAEREYGVTREELDSFEKKKCMAKPKNTAKKESSTSSPETSKPTLRARVAADLLKIGIGNATDRASGEGAIKYGARIVARAASRRDSGN